MILKLKRTPGIYLVGFMGSGKTTVGRMLARHLGWRFADLDDDIESHEQLSIPEIFEKKGEEEFRRIEADILNKRILDIARGVPWVIAVGGGCFTQRENVELMTNHGVSIWLDAPIEIVKSRVSHSAHRPLARDPEKFEELFRTRRACYEKAEYRVEVGAEGSTGAFAEILKLPLF